MSFHRNVSQVPNQCWRGFLQPGSWDTPLQQRTIRWFKLSRWWAGYEQQRWWRDGWWRELQQRKGWQRCWVLWELRHLVIWQSPSPARSNNSMGFRQDPKIRTQGASMSLCWYLIDGWGYRSISHGIWVPLGTVFKSVYFSFLTFFSFVCRSYVTFFYSWMTRREQGCIATNAFFLPLISLLL